MKRVWIIIAIIALVLTACAPKAEPTMSPADVQGTAMAAAMTMVAETQAAIPTATSIPPTAIPSATPFPTNTLPALAQPSLLGVPTTTQLFVVQPTNTKVTSAATSNLCNQPLMGWQGESATMFIKNATKPKGLVTLSLYFTTELGECGYIGTQFDSSTTIKVPMGIFSAGAFVDGKTDFKVFGGGEINRIANYTLWIENERISLK